MNIKDDQQYQTTRKEFLALKNRGNLTGQDQTRFDELQSAVQSWEASPNFHGDRIGGTRSGGESNIKGGVGDTSSASRS
jgi:hypothetical protein